MVFALLGFLQIATAPTRDSFLNNYDHGYQLGVGVQILHGKIPGVDIDSLWADGLLQQCALVPASAGRFWVKPSPVQCLCVVSDDHLRAAGTPCFEDGRSAGDIRRLSARSPVLQVVRLAFSSGHDLAARPGPGSTSRARRALIAATGLWVGLGWLFRWDIGTTGAAACCLYLLLTASELKSRHSAPVEGMDGLGISVFVSAARVVWLPLLRPGMGRAELFRPAVGQGGRQSLARNGYSNAPLQSADPLSPASIVVLGLRAGDRDVSALRNHRGECRMGGRSTAAIAAASGDGARGPQHVSSGLLPKGSYHLLANHSSRDPWILCADCRLYEHVAQLDASGLRARAVRFLGFAFLLGAAITGLGLMPFWSGGLYQLQPWPSQRLRELAHPLDPDRVRGAADCRVAAGAGGDRSRRSDPGLSRRQPVPRLTRSAGEWAIDGIRAGILRSGSRGREKPGGDP